MRILKALFILFLILLVLFLIIAFFLPSKMHIKKSIEINAPTSYVFEEINNFSLWSSWSPFQEKDPLMNIKFEGPARGNGAHIKWKSSEGNGTINWTEVTNEIILKGDFNYEGISKSDIVFEFEKTPQGCIVSWSIITENLSYPINRWKGFFIKSNLEDDLARGLNNLKSICETGMIVMGIKWKTSEIDEKEIGSLLAFTIKDSCTIEEFPTKLHELFEEIAEYMKTMNVAQNGSPFCVYYNWNPAGISVFEAGLPTAQSLKGKGRIQLSELSGTKVVMASQFGPYESTSDAHDAIDKYIKEKHLECTGAPWEVYITDIAKEPDTAKWETQVYYPVK